MDTALKYKIGLAVLLVAGLGIACLVPRLRAFIERFPVAFLLLSRLIPFTILYLVMHVSVPSDVSAFYYPQAIQTLAGKVPYRDFDSSYGMLFSYLNAGVLALWNAPWMLVLFSILVEAAAFKFWKRSFADNQGGKGFWVLVYIFNPLCLINTAVVGQNQILIGLFLAMAVYFHFRAVITPALLSISAIAVKFLSLLFVPPFFFATKQKIRFLLVFGLIIGGYFLTCFYLNADVLQPLKTESALYTSGNINYVLLGMFAFLRSVPYASTLPVADLLFAAAMLAVIILIYLKRAIPVQQYLAFSIVIIGMTFMLFSKKSFSGYLVIFWIPLIIILLDAGKSRWMVIHLVAYNIISMLEPSFWFTIMGRRDFNLVLPDASPEMIVFVLLQCAMIGYGAYFLGVIVRRFLAIKSMELTLNNS